MIDLIKSSPLTAALTHAIGTPMVVGLAYHGSTRKAMTGLDNVWGKHIDAQAFETHLKFLTSRYRIITVSELARLLHERKPLPRRSVFITFDDGYCGNYDVAFPLLKKYNARASFYIATSFIETGKRYPLDVIDAALKYGTPPAPPLKQGGEAGTSPSPPLKGGESQTPYLVRDVYKKLNHLEQAQFLDDFVRECGFKSIDDVPPLGEHTRFMTWAQMREMQAAGMEFGSHSHNHYIMARIAPEVAREELRTSKELLEANLQRPVDQFCYPNGHYPDDGHEATDKLVQEAGFRCALYMTGKIVTARTSPFRLHRRGIAATATTRELAAICAALGSRIRGESESRPLTG